MRWCKTIPSPLLCALAAAMPHLLHATGAPTEVTAQAKVHFNGAKPSEHHSNEGVVLWLTPVDASLPLHASSPPGNRLQLAQKNKQFVPHLLVVQVGSTVEFPNLDPFFHNVFSQFNGKRFDLGLYESGSSRSVHFDRVGVSYVFCNIHPEMSAVVVSVPTPYFATSTAAGKLAIHDVAPGNYMMHVWAMGSFDTDLATIGRRISVSGTAVDLGTIALEESPPRPHKNKFGEDYDAKKPASY
jgi:plastocyanin